jgi:hypothetical protein
LLLHKDTFPKKSLAKIKIWIHIVEKEEKMSKRFAILLGGFIVSNIYAADSLNVSFVGNWPFGPSWAITVDSTRALAFCGSGGGVYILDIDAPANPTKTSEKIHTKGDVNGLFYDESTQRLYIAAGQAGLGIWDVQDPVNPVKLGFYDTPDEAWSVAVSGSYAYVADWGC